jgi:hypothetical protein
LKNNLKMKRMMCSLGLQCRAALLPKEKGRG